MPLTGISTKIPEYKLTMAISLKIRDQLIKKGAKVLMTRESNEVDLGNIERAEIANKASVDIAVRIHADGSENLSVTGISVLYPGDQNINDEVLVRKSKEAFNAWSSSGLVINPISINITGTRDQLNPVRSFLSTIPLDFPSVLFTNSMIPSVILF